FGYGLSFTRFAYAAPRVSRSTVQAGDAVSVSVDVTNSGARDGDEVVQLYVSRPGGRAIRALQGFRRIHLKAGETQRVSFDLDARQLSTVDEKGMRSVVPGRVDLWIGGGQPDPRPGLAPAAGAAAHLTIRGSRVLPK
ncbi:MAG TPA: fibronectin type III-like domain-contianing protein, partial [Sphingomonas sp.]|nr:fibronectin type III-like domain-contianing protein [Sphingomonas sp.]